VVFLWLILFWLVLFLVIVKTTAGHPRPLPRGWLRGALCIHGHEGSWKDPNPPHWGGMQMSWAFMQAYGPALLRRLGTADHWTAHQQLHVAYRGWQARGWWPWPNTARKCGLL
jgi:hypothetical protein